MKKQTTADSSIILKSEKKIKKGGQKKKEVVKEAGEEGGGVGGDVEVDPLTTSSLSLDANSNKVNGNAPKISGKTPFPAPLPLPGLGGSCFYGKTIDTSRIIQDGDRNMTRKSSQLALEKIQMDRVKKKERKEVAGSSSLVKKIVDAAMRERREKALKGQTERELLGVGEQEGKGDDNPPVKHPVSGKRRLPAMV